MRTLYAADFLVTMDGDNRVIPDGAVLTDGDRIAAVGPVRDLAGAYPEAAVRDLPGRLLMPGLINTHTHSGLLRGLSLIHISEPTRLGMISYAVFCLKKK